MTPEGTSAGISPALRSANALRRRSRWASVSLAVVCIGTIADLPRTWRYATDALPALLAWPTPATQHRLTFAGEAYDFLRVADALLPPHETLLLITPGADARVLEYTIAHRALYQLTPRPIVWAAPAPRDRTWETRQLHTLRLEAGAIREEATVRGVRCVLAWGLELPAATGERLRRFAGGSLWALPGATADDCLRHPAATLGRPFVQRRWPLRLAGALLALLAIGGAGVAATASRGAPGCHGPEGLARAWLFGSGFVSFGMALLAAAGTMLPAQARVLGLAGAAGAILLVRDARSRRRARRDLARSAPGEVEGGRAGAARTRRFGPAQLAAALLVSLLVAQALFVFGLAVGRPLWVWDSWATWGSKARSVFVEQTIGPAVYADPTRAGTLLSYPLHVPLNEAWLYSWIGAPDDRIAGLVPALSWLALAALVHGAARRWGAGRLQALAATTAAAGIPFVAGSAAHAFADVPLAGIAALLAIALLDRARLGAERSSGLEATAILAAAMLPWTKREGWLLLACLAAATWLRNRRSRPLRAMLVRSLGGGVLVGGIWLAFVRWRGGSVGVGDFAAPPSGAVVSALERIPTILRLEVGILLDPAWAALWIVAAAWAATLAWRRLTSRFRRRGELPEPARSPVATGASSLLPLAVALYLASLTAAYSLSAYAPVAQHVLTSFFRLAVQVAPLFALWLAALAAGGAPRPADQAVATP